MTHAPHPSPQKSDYATLATTLEALADAAAHGDLERMLDLQRTQETLLQRIQRTAAAGRGNASPQLIDIIRRALQSIAAATPHIEKLRQSAQDEMAGTRRQLKVSQSYR